MPRLPRNAVSNSAADRAGDTYRSWLAMPSAEKRESFDALAEALRTIRIYRNMHAYPMTKVTLGVRSMVNTETRDSRLRPGQRHKRTPRILVKLARRPTMRLSQMEDIGGCRIVLHNLDQVYGVAERIMGRWGDHATLTDYIANPKDDGYRGIHIIEKRDGRLIEVQLRTPGEDEWAKSVEEYGPRLGYDLKDGEGPADLRLYFRLAADRIARAEAGRPPDASLEERFANVRNEVIHYFER